MTGNQRFVAFLGSRRGRTSTALALAGLSLISLARADSLAATFARGNRAFAHGDYTAAVSEYEKLEQAGVDDPSVSFNLAGAHGSLGHYGQAIRYFEHTLRLAPGDEAAEKGLTAARSALGERQAQQSGEAIVADRAPLASALFARLHVDTWSWLLVGGLWISSLCGLLLLRVRTELARLTLGITCAATGALALVAGTGLGILTDWGNSQARAVIVVVSAPLRDGPDPAAELRAELLEGTTIRVLAHEGAYLRVKSDSGEGFIQAADAGEI